MDHKTNFITQNHAESSVVCMNCGNVIQFEIECGNRTCVQCAPKRRSRIIKRLEPVVKNMKDPHFLTLTVRRRRLTRANIKQLRDNFTKLRHRNIWLGTVCGFYNIELGTLQENGTVNMHIHTVFDGLDIYQPYLSWIWSQITGDSYIVDIRICYSPQDVMHYVTKHFCKVIYGDYTEDQVGRINWTLRRKKLIQCYGPHTPKLPKTEKKVECPECHTINSFVSCNNPLYYDVLSAFDGQEYTNEPAIAIP